MKLFLPKCNDLCLLNMLARMDVKNELDLQEGCYWIGSCSGKKVEVEKYIALAIEGNIVDMAKNNYIGDDAVYAVVLRDKKQAGMVNIFIGTTCFSINPHIRILHTSHIKSDYDIVPASAAQQQLKCRPKWWHYLVDIVFPGKGVSLAFKHKE